MRKVLLLVCIVVLFFVCVSGVGTAFTPDQNSNGTVMKAGPVVPKPEPWGQVKS